MSAAGSIIKKRIAKAILNQIKWNDWNWPVEGHTMIKIVDLEVTTVSDNVATVRVKTANQGTLWFTIKISENY